MNHCQSRNKNHKQAAGYLVNHFFNAIPQEAHLEPGNQQHQQHAEICQAFQPGDKLIFTNTGET